MVSCTTPGTASYAYSISGYDSGDCGAATGKLPMYTGTGPDGTTCQKLATNVYVKVMCQLPQSNGASAPAVSSIASILALCAGVLVLFGVAY